MGKCVGGPNEDSDYNNNYGAFELEADASKPADVSLTKKVVGRPSVDSRHLADYRRGGRTPEQQCRCDEIAGPIGRWNRRSVGNGKQDEGHGQGAEQTG